MTNENFYQLYQFLGAYFHEDWMGDFDSADEVVKSFFDDSDESTLTAVSEEINELVSLDMKEVELREFLLKDLGCCYCYWHEWGTGQAWLEHVFSSIQSRKP
ncbi:contact-dependent growth inhibition system immunity protein [Pseudomonas koreensis]|uniref:Contact-dependent growth inhibition system immunity protein n=1 Tax=Pseudomonas koreensis TaxID=198620 RepID=A0A9X2XMV5_9PSED|nr:contact-dependent growth inhibition system immunity protein [Pseudomonas koreensis]MCU7251294.1 contact-dependent growth inhibition system immunity protein [Pseudomonas koreensis]